MELPKCGDAVQVLSFSLKCDLYPRELLEMTTPVFSFPLLEFL